MIKLRLLLGSLLVFIIFLLIQDLRFTYFEKIFFYNKIDIILIPTISLIVIYGVYKNKRKFKTMNWSKLKEFFWELVAVVVAYSVLRILLMKILVFTNSCFVLEEKVINGIISKKIYIEGGYKTTGTYRLEIKTNDEFYEFDSKGFTIKKLKAGDSISLKMSKGLLTGLFMKDSQNKN